VDVQPRRGLLDAAAAVQVGPDRGLVHPGALGQQRGDTRADPLRCRLVARQILENGVAAQLAPVRGPAERGHGRGDLRRVARIVQLDVHRRQRRRGAGRADDQGRPGQGPDGIAQRAGRVPGRDRHQLVRPRGGQHEAAGRRPAPQVAGHPRQVVVLGRGPIGQVPDQRQGVRRRAGQRRLTGQLAGRRDAVSVLGGQQRVGQPGEGAELRGLPGRPLVQQPRGLRRGGFGPLELRRGQGRLVDQPQEAEQLIAVRQRQAQPGQAPRFGSRDRHRLPRLEDPVLGEHPPVPCAGAPLQHRLDPAGVHQPGLRADRHRAQRGIVDDHRTLQGLGQLFGHDLELLLEHAALPFRSYKCINRRNGTSGSCPMSRPQPAGYAGAGDRRNS
jgi:hypothetical protein